MTTILVPSLDFYVCYDNVLLRMLNKEEATDDPDGAFCEDEHTLIEVEEIEAKTAAENKK